MKWVNQTVHRILLMKLLTSDEEMITDNLPQAERSPGHRAAADYEERGGNSYNQEFQSKVIIVTLTFFFII